jgi:EAL domain-containing protein (putative c-di-GMP-specific phosphodiesterase class I)
MTIVRSDPRLFAPAQDIRPLPSSGTFWRGVADSVDAEVAVLNRDGTIIAVNAAWTAFAEDDGFLCDEELGVGADYLGVCDAAADEPFARDVATAIRRAIDGETKPFSAEYPCHRPCGERRWFTVRVTRFKGTGAGRVVVVHLDDTERILASEERRSAREFTYAEKERDRLLLLEMEDLRAEQKLRHAIRAQRLELYAQPIVPLLDSTELPRYELLVRMRDEGGTLLPPAAFLPGAERTGFVIEIDKWVISQGVTLAAAGHQVGINLSACSLADASVLTHIETELLALGAAPELITFELTETAVMKDLPGAQSFLTRLRELGCKIALDDFGSGYGGFTYLKYLPVDLLKIDREFVSDLPDDAAGRHVVDAVVRLAKAFGLRTIAEGVETKASLALLSELGVDFAQGYLLGRPKPLADVFTTAE